MPFEPWCYAIDATRSCYATLCRIPGVGVIPIRWFFTDSALVNRETVYGSHNHIREDWSDDVDTGEPGEVWGSRRVWVDGSPPTPGLCSGDGGTDSTWLGNEDPSSPSFLSPPWPCEFDESYSVEYFSRTYVDGLP